MEQCGAVVQHGERSYLCTALGWHPNRSLPPLTPQSPPHTYVSVLHIQDMVATSVTHRDPLHTAEDIAISEFMCVCEIVWGTGRRGAGSPLARVWGPASVRCVSDPHSSRTPRDRFSLLLRLCSHIPPPLDVCVCVCDCPRPRHLLLLVRMMLCDHSGVTTQCDAV